MDDVIRLVGARVDPVNGRVYGEAGIHALTATELALLVQLVAARGQVCSRDELASDPQLTRSALDQVVRRLRRKIERTPADPDNVLTVFGGGYRLGRAPVDVDPFRDAGFGRSALRSRIAEHLQVGGVLSLVGPPGVGKTRLAREVMELVQLGFPGGVGWVDLSGASAVERCAELVGTVLGLPPSTDDPHLRRALAVRGPTALVLDNTEQIPGIGEWIRAVCGAAAVLVTSRSVTGAADEQVVEVPPLPVDAAVALFVDRAANAAGGRALGDLSTVAALVERLDRLPLAIELAAGRAGIASPAAILARIEGGVAFLRSRRRDVPPRHLTLEAAFDASWELLDDDAREVLAASTVFAATFDQVEAEAVVGRPIGGALDELASRHLLRRVGDDRFRHYVALGPWAAATATAAQRLRWEQAHAAWFARYGAEAGWSSVGLREDHASFERARAASAELERVVERAAAWGDGATAVEAALALALVKLLDGSGGSIGPVERALTVAGAPPERWWQLELRAAWLERVKIGRGRNDARWAALVDAAPSDRDRWIAQARGIRAASLSEPERWWERAEAVVSASEGADPAARAVVATTAAVRAYEAGRVHLGTTHAARAVALRRSLGDERSLIPDLHLLYTFLLAELRFADAAALEPELEALLATCGQRRTEAHYAFDHARRQMEFGDPAAAEWWFFEGRRRMDQLGDAVDGHSPWLYVAAVWTNLGRFDDAVAACTRVIEEVPALGVIAHLMRGALRLEGDQLEASLQDLALVDQLPDLRGNPMRARFEGARACALARLGRPDRARFEAAVGGGRHDPMTAALNELYRIDQALAEGDATELTTARATARALVTRAGLPPTSTYAVMAARRGAGAITEH